MTKEQELKLQEQALLNRLNDIRRKLNEPVYSSSDVTHMPLFVVTCQHTVDHKPVVETIGVFDNKAKADAYVEKYADVHALHDDCCGMHMKELNLNAENL